MFPAAGPTTGGTSVRIAGDLPANPIVRFGGSPGSLVHADGDLVIVLTPAHRAGPVDVRVSGNGDTVDLAGAFTYVGEDPVPGPVEEPEEPEGPPARTARQPFDAPNGLRLDAFLDGHPLRGLPIGSWAGGGCTTAVCTAVSP